MVEFKLEPQEAEKLKAILENLSNKIKLKVILPKDGEYNTLYESFIKEISSLSDKIEFIKLTDSTELKEKYKYIEAPVLTFENYENIQFNGFPAGYEFVVFLEDLFMISENKTSYDDNLIEHVKKIDKPLKILVFTTPQCPYCIYASKDAHTIGYLNKNITSIVINSIEFPLLANQYNVHAVPKVVILDEDNNILDSWEGAIPSEDFISRLLQL